MSSMSFVYFCCSSVEVGGAPAHLCCSSVDDDVLKATTCQLCGYSSVEVGGALLVLKLESAISIGIGLLLFNILVRVAVFA